MTVAYAEMPVRIRAGIAFPYPADRLSTGATIGSRLESGCPPVVLIAGDIGCVRQVKDAFEDFNRQPSDYRVFAIYRWEQHDWWTEREVVGLSVYCVDPVDAVMIKLKFSDTGGLDQFAQAA